MANYTSMEHLKFLLLDVHCVEDLFQYERFSHLDAEQAWMIIESAKLLADQAMYPVFKEMDATPATYDGKGGVTTHPQLKNIMRQAAEQHGQEEHADRWYQDLHKNAVEKGGDIHSSP